jgi:preprotein translocase subunit SecG
LIAGSAVAGPAPQSTCFNVEIRREVRVYLAIQIVLVITSVLMSLFVLLHKGKGGGLSSLFGGGMQSNLSGSTVVEKNLDYVTIITAILWLASIVLLGLFQAFNW